jgi:hypothetical protein
MLTKTGGKLLYQSKINEVTCIHVTETAKQGQVCLSNQCDKWTVEMPVIKVVFSGDKVIAIGERAIKELSLAGVF